MSGIKIKQIVYILADKTLHHIDHKCMLLLQQLVLLLYTL